MNSNVLDLDVLADPKRPLRLNGKTLYMSAPKLADIVRLTELGKRLQNINSSNLSQDRVKNEFEEITEVVDSFVPGIKDENPNLPQLLAIMNAAVEMAMPSDVKELADMGIEIKPSEEGPKARSAGEGNSQDSFDSTAGTPLVQP